MKNTFAISKICEVENNCWSCRFRLDSDCILLDKSLKVDKEGYPIGKQCKIDNIYCNLNGAENE